jgi:PIN domain nuclease of toxin-antitoxin system
LRLLLDTHVALWAIADDKRLPRDARDLIVDPDNTISVSASSVWEIAIKRALARGSKNDMPISGTDALKHFQAAGYELLAISASHAAAVDRLPPLHNDPFDRLLIAQALTEPLRLLTHDAQLARYSESIIVI